MEDFVPYETVLKLEEKGYKGKTIRYHGHIYDVLKWLREEKRIEVNACWDNIDAQWIGYASEMDKPDLVGYYTSIDYDSYEQATLAGVEYVLDKLI